MKMINKFICASIAAFLPLTLSAQITTWDQLYTAMQNGGTITLTKDISYSGSKGALVVPKGKTVTLDLNGCTVNRACTAKTDGGNVITVEGTLLIKDSSGKDTGIITGGWNSARGGGIINYGTLTLEGGCICGNKSDVSYKNVTNANDEVNRTGGGGVYQNGTMIMNGGVISGNISGNYGGGVLNGKTKNFTINGGRISENSAANSGGGIANFGLVIQNNGQISSNRAKNGGGVYNMCNKSSEGYKMEKGFVFSNVAEGQSSTKSAGSGGGFYIGNDSENKNATYYIKPGSGVYGNLALNVAGNPGKADEIGQSNEESIFSFPHVNEMVTADGAPMSGEWYTDNEKARFREGKGAIYSETSVKGKVYLAVGAPCPWCALQDEINAAANGSTITLNQDYLANLAPHKHGKESKEADLALIIPSGKNITIDLNGHRIDRNLAGKTAIADGNVFYVSTGASLTINDSSAGTGNPYGKGVITGGNNSLVAGGGISVDANANLIINAGTISGCTSLSGGAVNVLGNESNFIMNGGQLTNCEGTVDPAELLEEDRESGLGGAVTITSENSTFTMNGGLISDCVSLSGGGVFINMAHSSFVMNGGTIDNCKAVYTPTSGLNAGGGGAFANHGLLRLNGGTIMNCESHDGGGMCTPNGSIVIEAGNIINCKASNSYSGDWDAAGGGIYAADEDASIVISGGNISGCSAVNGGGVFSNLAQMTISGGSISSNTAVSNGGGVFSGKNLSISGGVIGGEKSKSNTAMNGAGLSVSGYCDYSNGTISYNTSSNSGAGVYVSKSSAIKIESNASIANNSSMGNGGAVFNDGIISIEGTPIFSNNSAKSNGNGIYQSGSMLLSGSPSFGKDQDVYLPSVENPTDVTRSTYVITKAGEIGSVTVPVKVANEVSGRDILVSMKGATEGEDVKVVEADLAKISVIQSVEELIVIFNPEGRDGGLDPKEVIEFGTLPGLIIRRSGLNDGENAIYSVYYSTDGTAYTPAFKVSMNKEDNTPAGKDYAERTIKVSDPGYYKVVEESWTWAYSPDEEPSVSPAEISVSHGDNWASAQLGYSQAAVYTFSGAAKEEVSKHDEAVVTNKFGNVITPAVDVRDWKDAGKKKITF